MTSSQDIIRMMLARAARPGNTAPDYADAADYDWHQPHTLPQGLLFDAQGLFDRAAEALSAALGRVVRDDLTVRAADLTEAYASTLREAAPSEGTFYVPLMTADEQPCGFLGTSDANAARWVARLLGGSAGQGTRQMSALELSLLGDVMASLAAAILEPICTAADVDITPGRSVSPAIVPLGQDTAEFIEVDMSRIDEDNDAQAIVTLAVRSDMVVRAVSGPDESDARGAADRRKRIIEHLSRVSVTARARLGQTETTVREAAALAVGDVLVLDTCLGDEVDVFVQGTRVARGTPASCEGYNAVCLTEVMREGAADAGSVSDDINA